METQIKIAGWLMIVLALVHIVFPGYFKWKNELKPLSVINRQLMYVHCFFVAFVILLAGLLCITSSYDLIATHLGHNILTGFSVFWITRLVFQFLVYSPDTWKGKKFETAVHIILSFLWIYFSVVFVLSLL
jgi:hypothetical protein